MLIAYAQYYNLSRPMSRPVQREGRIRPIPYLGGLHHSYARIKLLVGTTLARTTGDPQESWGGIGGPPAEVGTTSERGFIAKRRARQDKLAKDRR